MRVVDAYQASFTTTASIVLASPCNGGLYAVHAVGATFSQANIEVLGPDNATWVTAVTTVVATNAAPQVTVNLPPVNVRANVSGISCIVRIWRVAGE